MFDRVEDDNIYMEDSKTLPFIIKYTDWDVDAHNKNKDVPFKDYMESLSGIHDLIIINRGVNDKGNFNEFEVAIENASFTVKLRIDEQNNYFFLPKFFERPILLPDSDDEFLRIKANIVFTKNVSIGFWSSNHFIDRISDIAQLIQQCMNLSIPFDDSQLGESNKRAWKVYAEGMSKLNKEKQALLPIKAVSTPHKIKTRGGELITVIDVDLAIDSRENVFKKSINSFFANRVESKYKDFLPHKK